MAKAVSEIVQTLKEAGRSAGFSELRDLLLTEAAALKQDGIGLPTLVKMVLEIDRHAMAAEMMAAKLKGGEAPTEWTSYQQYLSGEITLPEYLAKSKPGIKAPTSTTPTEETTDGVQPQQKRSKARPRL